jgi:hypothetical protein
MLFAGIAIMMSPMQIIGILSSKPNSVMLGAIIMLASILMVTGLVGIAVMGFIVSKI